MYLEVPLTSFLKNALIESNNLRFEKAVAEIHDSKCAIEARQYNIHRALEASTKCLLYL